MSDACRIRALPEVVINQIAAGEVIERPASVLKELLENSLDAGATDIQVDAEGGGVRRIRVRDNGAGMTAGELEAALRRHCTSKISGIEDLESIVSLGFRGEALPSIAAVSTLSLSSRTAGAEHGWRVEADGGRLSGPQPDPQPAGTCVDVRDLFVHVPARRRFLRSPRTELLHLQDVLRRVALARFDLRIRAELEGRPFLRLPAAVGASERLRRLGGLLGRAFAESAVWVSERREGLALEGWLGDPARARTSTDQQYVFLNGRPVRDPRLAHALRRAYEAWLAPGRYPAFVLYLALDPATVDVNVHPAKAEVRFQDTRLVHDFLHASVRQALREACTPGLPAVPPHGAEPAGPGPSPVPSDAGDVAPPAQARPGGPRVGAPAAQAGPGQPGAGATARRRPGTGGPPAPGGDAWALYRGRRGEGMEALREPAGEAASPGRALVAGRYLLCALPAEAGQGGPAPATDPGPAGALLLVDTWRLWRHLAQVRWREGLEGAKEPASRPLLLPEAAQADAETVARVEAAGAALRRLGVDLAPGGPRQVLLRALPEPLARTSARAVLERLLGHLGPGGDLQPEALMRAVLHDLVPTGGQARAGEDLAALLALPGGRARLVPPLARLLEAAELARWLEAEPARR